MKFYALVFFFLLNCCCGLAQQSQEFDSLRREFALMRTDVQNIQLNLGKSEKKFKRGILVATIGYTVTIAGGLMLGRKQDDLGKVLLVCGGATGITGTVMMLDSFKYLGRAGKRRVR